MAIDNTAAVLSRDLVLNPSDDLLMGRFVALILAFKKLLHEEHVFGFTVMSPRATVRTKPSMIDGTNLISVRWPRPAGMTHQRVALAEESAPNAVLPLKAGGP